MARGGSRQWIEDPRLTAACLSETFYSAPSTAIITVGIEERYGEAAQRYEQQELLVLLRQTAGYSS